MSPEDPHKARQPAKRSTPWRSVARAPRREAAEEEFMAALPRDENWIADLGFDAADGAPVDTGRGGAAPVAWLAVEERLREQRALIGALTARLDALEKAMAEGPLPWGASSIFGPRLVWLARSMSRFMRWLTAKNGR